MSPKVQDEINVPIALGAFRDKTDFDKMNLQGPGHLRSLQNADWLPLLLVALLAAGPVPGAEASYECKCSILCKLACYVYTGGVPSSIVPSCECLDDCQCKWDCLKTCRKLDSNGQVIPGSTCRKRSSLASAAPAVNDH